MKDKINYFTSVVVTLQLFEKMEVQINTRCDLSLSVDVFCTKKAGARVFKIELLDDEKVEVFFDEIEYES